jgi:hypothetical protein
MPRSVIEASLADAEATLACIAQRLEDLVFFKGRG